MVVQFIFELAYVRLAILRYLIFRLYSMKKDLKHQVKYFIRKIIRYFLKKAIIDNLFLFKEIDIIAEQKEVFKNNLILGELQSCGNGVKLKGKIIISEPKTVVIGHNVHIEENAYFLSEGGLTIGDYTHISRNVTIYTVDHNYPARALPYNHTGIAKPVAIGKNVWIGANASILPGVRIGDGAIISMGTIVTNDIPPLAIVGNQPSRILQYRDAEHYKYLEEEYFNQDGNKLFFVVTTGRSGSTTISSLLSQHSQLTCLHEPRLQLIRLSTEFAHGEKSYEQTKDELDSIYCNSSNYPLGIYGESDQKLWNLIEIIAELMPSSRFIWLIRDGRDVVASTYARRWFDKDIENREGSPTSPNKFLCRWMYYRIDGAKCGVFSQAEWDEMSVFEKNCWYWSYVNSSIEKQLQQLPGWRWYTIKLEEIEDKVSSLLNFLGVEFEPLTIPKLNAFKPNVNWYKTQKHWYDWEEREKLAFIKYCGKEMDKWYPNWR